MTLIQSYLCLENKTSVALQSATPFVTAVGALVLTSSLKSVTAVPILGAAAFLSAWLFRTLVTQTQTLAAHDKVKRDLEGKCTTLEGQIPDKDAKARVDAEVQKQQELKQQLTKDNQALLQQVQAAETKLQEAAKKRVVQSSALPPARALPELSPQPSSLTAPELLFWVRFKIAKEGDNPALEEKLSQWAAAEAALKGASEGPIPSTIVVPFKDLPLAYKVACDNQLKTLADRFASELVEGVCKQLQAGYVEATRDVASWEASKESFALNHVPREFLRQIVEKVNEPLMLIGLLRDNEEYFKTEEGAAVRNDMWKKLCLKDRCSNDQSCLARLVAQVGTDASWEDLYFYDVSYSANNNKIDILLSLRGSQVRRLSFSIKDSEKLTLALQRCPSLERVTLSHHELEPSVENWEALAAISTLEKLEFYHEMKGLVQGLKKFNTLPMLIFINQINLQQFAEQGIVLKKLGISLDRIKDPALSPLLAEITDLDCGRVDLSLSTELIKALACLKKLKRLYINFRDHSRWKTGEHQDLEKFFLDRGIKLEWGPSREW